MWVKFQKLEQENTGDYLRSLDMIIETEQAQEVQMVYKRRRTTHLHFSVDTKSPST
jgi:hypothetical protein